MGTHMKTAIDLSDALFDSAKKLAQQRRTMLRALVEEGLRRVIADAQTPGRLALRLQAIAQVDAWPASPSAQVLHSGAQHWRVLSELARSDHLQGGQFHDARIAAICLGNGADELLSADRYFGRFKALRVVNPLV